MKLKKYWLVLVPVLFMILMIYSEAACNVKAGSITPSTTPTPSASPTPTPTTAPAPTATPVPTLAPTPVPVNIASTTVLYTEEEIRVTAQSQVYYAVLKKAGETSVNVSNLIAAPIDFDGSYLIDFSVMSPTKSVYIGLTANITADAAGLVTVLPLEIKATPKKTVFQLNWAKEGQVASGRGIFSSVEVTEPTGEKVLYKELLVGDVESATLKPISKLKIQWQKGVNGVWKDIGQLTEARWRSMQISGATVLFRVGAVDQSATELGQRYSKSVKIKISSSKAPALKQDVNKLTLPIKNGIEYRKAGETSWTTVLPYNAKSLTVIPTLNGQNIYDPSKHNTSTKVTYMDINSLANSTEQGAGMMILEVRSAATTKKPPSKASRIMIALQAAPPTVTISASTGSAIGYTVTALTKNAADKTESTAFEYMIIAATDIPNLDMAKAKWTTIKQGATIKATAKTSLVLKDGMKRTYAAADTGTVFLVRRKGISGNAKKLAVLASQYTTVTK